MSYLSHCQFWWRGLAWWWAANQLPFNFTTLPQQSSSVGVGRLDPRKSLQTLGYVIGKSIKDNNNIDMIILSTTNLSWACIYNYRRSPTNWTALCNNEFKRWKMWGKGIEEEIKGQNERDRDTLAPNVPEINSNFCFFRPGACACPDPCRGTKSTWNLYVTPKACNQWPERTNEKLRDGKRKVGATMLALPLYRSHSIRFVEQESVWREKKNKKKPWLQWKVCWRFNHTPLYDNHKAHCCHLVVTLQPNTIYKVQPPGWSAIWTRKKTKGKMSKETS